MGKDTRGHATHAMGLVFSDEVLPMLKAGYQLSFTGHSLGGFLAEGVTDLCLNEVFQDQVIGILSITDSDIDPVSFKQSLSQVSAVTFDSPGFEDALGTRRNSVKDLNVLSFKFWLNPVNTVLIPSNPSMVYALTPDLEIDIFSNPLKHLLTCMVLSAMVIALIQRRVTPNPAFGIVLVAGPN